MSTARLNKVPGVLEQWELWSIFSIKRNLSCVSDETRLFRSTSKQGCTKRADDLLKLRRHQLKTVIAILRGHAPVRGHLYIMGLFDGDPTCRFCRLETETVQHVIFCCEVLARQRYNVFGKLTVEPNDTNTASVMDLCLFIRGTGLLNLGWMEDSGLHNKPKAAVHPER